MLHVAFDNGFPNVEAFLSSIFKKRVSYALKELRQEKKSQKINKEKNYREALSVNRFTIVSVTKIQSFLQIWLLMFYSNKLIILFGRKS